MTFNEYTKEERSTKDIFFYLFDCLEWTILFDEDEQTPSIFDDGKNKYFNCFVDKEIMQKEIFKLDYDALFSFKAKIGLINLLVYSEDLNIDGVKINNSYFISKAEILNAYFKYLNDYYDRTMQIVEKIADVNMKRLQYMRAFFMLPKTYLLNISLEDDDKTGLLFMREEINGKKSPIGFIFDSKENADNYIKEMNLGELGNVEAIEFSTEQLIHNQFNGIVEYILVNGKNCIPYKDFEKMENMFVLS